MWAQTGLSMLCARDASTRTRTPNFDPPPATPREVVLDSVDAPPTVLPVAVRRIWALLAERGSSVAERVLPPLKMEERADRLRRTMPPLAAPQAPLLLLALLSWPEEAGRRMASGALPAHVCWKSAGNSGAL